MSNQEKIYGGLLVAEALVKHNVSFLFTLCGGHISPILVGAKSLGIRVVDVRHEATAVFAADAVSRITGIPGVVAVTAGPGLTNTVTAVKNAQMAQSPLILLGGATATLLKGRGALQDIDQMALLKPHVKCVFPVRRVCEIVPMLDDAFAVAQSGVPGPVFLEYPVDILYPEDQVRDLYGKKKIQGKKSLKLRMIHFYINRHINRIFSDMEKQPESHPIKPYTPGLSMHKVSRAFQFLQEARKPLLLVGSQAMFSPSDAEQVKNAIESLQIPVYLTGMARGLLGSRQFANDQKDSPDTLHPLQIRHKRKEALREADLVILTGVPCDFRLDYGQHISHSATLISVNRSTSDLSKNRHPDLGIHADPAQFLKALSQTWALSASKPQGNYEPWLKTLKERDRERNEEIRTESQTATDNINPLALCREMERAMAENSIIVADGGDFVATASYIVSPRKPLSWLDPGPFGTLGIGAGFAIGAKLCRPDAEVWLLYGDGSCGYTLCEFDTLVRHKIPIIAVVGNDACWSQIAREQMPMLKDDVGTRLRYADYHKVVQGFGAEGLCANSIAEIPEILQQAKNMAQQNKPVLVNAILGTTDFRKGSISV